MEKTNLERHIVHRDTNFKTICTIVMNDETLSLEAQWLHTKIYLLPPSWQFSIKGLSKLTGVSAYKIKNALRELEEHGYLVRSHLRDPETGQYITNEFGVGTQYDFFEEPVSVKTSAEDVDPRQITMEQYLGGEEPEKPVKKGKSTSDYTEDFEEAWAAYGRIGNKKTSAKAYKKAAKKVSQETILAGIEAYKKYLSDTGIFCADFSTWLNRDGWDADYEAMTAARVRKKSYKKTPSNPSTQAKKPEEKSYDYGFGNKIEVSDSLDNLWI